MAGESQVVPPSHRGGTHSTTLSDTQDASFLQDRRPRDPPQVFSSPDVDLRRLELDLMQDNTRNFHRDGLKMV